MNKLEEKLISLSENDYGFALYCDEEGNEEKLEFDPYSNNIIKNGVLFQPKKMFCLDMPTGECHQNVAKVFHHNEQEEGDKLYTGYTQQYTAGGWMQHSWIVDKEGLVVESTSNNSFPQYFGIELKGQDLELFINIWSDFDNDNVHSEDVTQFLKNKENKKSKSKLSP